jgi:hypothetical protein
MSDLERRIETLEKVSRRWRYAAVSLVGIMLIALVSGGKPADDVPDLLQARRIEVLRPDGKPGIVLQANDKGSGLSIRAWAESNKDRDPAVVLEANKNRSGLSVTARGNGHQRGISFGANGESVGMVFMKHKEYPLLKFDGNDDGCMLAMFDGHEPSQNPTTILLKTEWSEEDKRGLTGIALAKEREMHLNDMRAGLFMGETDAMEMSYLQLGGSQGKTAIVKVNQENGKLEVTDQGNKGMWTTP